MLSLHRRGRARFILAFGKLACLLNRHAPYRNRAGWDGTAYVSHCRECGQPIKRVARHQWRRQTDASHDTPPR